MDLKKYLKKELDIKVDVATVFIDNIDARETDAEQEQIFSLKQIRNFVRLCEDIDLNDIKKQLTQEELKKQFQREKANHEERKKKMLAEIEVLGESNSKIMRTMKLIGFGFEVAKFAIQNGGRL